MVAGIVAATIAVGSPARAEPARAAASCVDQEIAQRLAVKRMRRGYDDALFVKQARHELSVLGGYYVSDLYSSSYVAGGTYTYHMTNVTAVELGAAYTRNNAELIRALEDERGQALADESSRSIFAESLLVWSPIHGKLRLGGAIAHFDIHLDVGVGVVDSETSRGAAGVAGVGMKLFVGRAVAVRVEVRDHVFQQELLDQTFLVNDVSATLGLSVFLPVRN